jgi:hypothetical protein
MKKVIIVLGALILMSITGCKCMTEKPKPVDDYGYNSSDMYYDTLTVNVLIVNEIIQE